MSRNLSANSVQQVHDSAARLNASINQEALLKSKSKSYVSTTFNKNVNFKNENTQNQSKTSLNPPHKRNSSIRSIMNNKFNQSTTNNTNFNSNCFNENTVDDDDDEYTDEEDKLVEYLTPQQQQLKRYQVLQQKNPTQSLCQVYLRLRPIKENPAPDGMSYELDDASNSIMISGSGFVKKINVK